MGLDHLLQGRAPFLNLKKLSRLAAAQEPEKLLGWLAEQVAMLRHRRPVFVESKKGRFRVPFKMPESATPVDVSLRLRERGWTPYKVFFDRQSQAWIALVIDREQAA